MGLFQGRWRSRPGFKVLFKAPRLCKGGKHQHHNMGARLAGRQGKGGGNDGESGCAGFEFARGGGGPEKRCQSEDHTTEASSVAGSAECVNTTVSKQSQSLVKSNQGKSRQGRS